MASELSRLIEDELKNKGFYEGGGQAKQPARPARKWWRGVAKGIGSSVRPADHPFNVHVQLLKRSGKMTTTPRSWARSVWR